MNTKYGRLANGQIEYAPNALATEDGYKVNPSEASYLAAGWKKIVDVAPEAEDGTDVLFSAWEESETAITARYKLVAHTDEPLPSDDTPSDAGDAGGTDAETPADTTPVKGHRVFSKLKLLTALKAADKWVLVKTWLEEKAYYDFYVAAQDLAEDNPLFAEGCEAIKKYLGVSDEEVEAILSTCLAD